MFAQTAKRTNNAHARTLDNTRDLLRALLRDTAQSVAVVTAVLPPSTTSAMATSTAYHGATLSSFTSVALHPFPLVAFSLRVPSRMAAALNRAHVASSSSSRAPTSSSSSSHPAVVHLVINMLSAAQPHVAHRFAQPDIHPHPFADRRRVPWTLSPEGLPVLSGALGALSCSLVGPSLPLAHVGDSSHDDTCAAAEDDVSGYGPGRTHQGAIKASSEVPHALTGGLESELFIARVLRVEHVPQPELTDDKRGEDAGLYKLPLLYHQRRYTTVQIHNTAS